MKGHGREGGDSHPNLKELKFKRKTLHQLYVCNSCLIP